MHNGVLLSTILVLLGNLTVDVDSLEAQHPPCMFNQLCSCSKSGPTMGHVQCHNVQMLTIPEDIKESAIFILSLRSNNLRVIQNSSFDGTGMWKLQITDNDITTLPKLALKGLEKTLWELDLSRNKLFSVPKDAMQKLQRLKSLDLSQNRISYLESDDFEAVGKTLKSLNLKGNSLTHIKYDSFKGLKVLESLDLESNFIFEINEMAFKSGAPKLRYLNLADNQLRAIPFLSVNHLENLKVLNLRENNIVSTYDVAFREKLSLDELNLEGNMIDNLQSSSFRNFHAINKTFLGRNSIQVVPDEAFKDTMIIEVKMPFCDIWNISSRAFEGLEKSLHALDVSFNELMVFPSDAISEIEGLKELHLAHNHITNSAISSDTLGGLQYTLQNLDLTGQDLHFTGENEDDAITLRNIRKVSLGALPDNVLGNDDLQHYGPVIENLNLANMDIMNIEDNAFQNSPGVKVLNLTGNNIHSIGAEAFRDLSGTLEVLNMRHSLAMDMLPTYALHYLRNLRELDLSDNAITALPMDSFAYMSKLKHLYLDFNNIRDIHYGHFLNENNPNLISIHLSFNKLTQIEEHTFDGLEKLEVIDLSDNFISHIKGEAFMNLKSIVRINLEGNAISTIDFEAFRNIPRLRILNMAYNSLEQLNLDAFDQVGTLSTFRINAKHNKINYLEANNNTIDIPIVSISALDLSHNNISSIESEYFDPVRNSLTHLMLSDNVLSKVSSSDFAHMRHLQKLELNDNLIDTIETGAFHASTNLQVVNLSGNNLSQLPETLLHKSSKLKILDVSKNQLYAFEGDQFSGTSLEFLYAEDNELSHFPDEALRKINNTIKGICIGGNNIEALDSDSMSHFRNLIKLDISRNNLEQLADGVFSSLHKLIELDISHNPLQKITSSTFEGLDFTLEVLNLSGTNLTAIPPAHLIKLLILNVSHNLIEDVEEISPAIANIRELDITDNALTRLPDNVFPKLKTLRLSENPITGIFDDSFHGLQELNELYMYDLPLRQLQNEAFKSLPSLHTIAINYDYTKIDNFNLGDALSANHGLRHIILKTDSPVFQNLLPGGTFPRKLNKITINGEGLETIDDLALDSWTGQHLHLEISSTNMTRFSDVLLKNIHKARYLTLDVRNNQLSYLGDATEVTPTSQSFKLRIKKLLLSGNPWKCNCDIAWVMDWLKEMHRAEISHEFRTEKNEAVKALLEDLRQTECQEEKFDTLVDLFKSDLDCSLARFKGSNAQGPARSNTFFYWLLSLVSLMAAFCEY